MPTLRILSYLPNPRVANATIAARPNGVDVELRGGQPAELADWLLDFDGHPLSTAERADDAALTSTAHIAEEALTLADICVACELTLLALERHEHDRLAAVNAEALFGAAVATHWPRAHFLRLLADPGFAPDLGPYDEPMTLAKVFG